MAEARREEEEELKDASVLCNRNQATDRSERNKPDQIQPSSRPLASIRAAFKRTSGRTPSQSDHTRDRRRPEITIVSAEPLASTSWFPGASALPSPQPVWGASIPVAAKPPPSYDQVIKEKTQEQDVTPTPPPRRSHTTTIATQTDTVDTANSPDPECRTPSQSSSCEAPKLKRPPKPPRPSFSVKPNPAPRESPLLIAEPALNQRETKSTHTEDIASVNAPLINAIHLNTTDYPNRSPAACTASGLELEPSELRSISDNIVPDVSNPDPSSPSDSSRIQAPRPVPRPRTRPSKPVRTEVKVQTLVRIKDSGDALQVISDSSRDSPPNPYLKELLEVFNSDAVADLSDSGGSNCELSDESGDDSSDMSIRTKIQAFEGQVSTNDHVGTPVPVPKPRNQQSKPPMLAPKPALVPQPSVKRQIDENHNESGNEVASVASKLVPALVPRPVPPKKPSIDQRDDPTVVTPKAALLPPPRPPLQNKPISFLPEETPMTKAPPPVLRKPSRELLNHNNHNSTSLSSAPSGATEWPNLRSSRVYSGQSKQENEIADSPAPAPTPPKPVRGVEGSFNRGGVMRKPTMIRVPSTSGKLADDSQDAPPPLPVQMPVGGPPPPSQKNSFRSQDFGSGSSPEPLLPPRPASVKVLPPRPPPAKAGPDRPPPPRKEAFQPPASVSSVAKGASANEGQYQERRSSKTPKKGPVLPPRPKPGHPLYNKYTLEIPHAIAEFDCNGTNPGELSFQKNEVLVLLDQIDSKTFECQAGAVSGRVQKSYMKIITPLSAHSLEEAPQNTQPEPSGNGGMQVQALHDFIPEGPGELHLRAGDVVGQVEQLDDEWYLGTLRGVTGFFPISYVKLTVRSSKPISQSAVPSTHAKTLPEAPSSGPRCVARFAFEAEHSDELMFCEGDVIQLHEYIGQDWARGKLGTCVGIFPLNYVEIIEDLPAQTASDAGQTKIALPGMVSSPSMSSNPNQAEWAEALYDFTAETDDDLPFQQGDRILVTAHMDEEWCSGRVHGREGVFPKAFVQFS
ncbi:SH3 domain-containing protein 19 isoform X1 [Alosa sapidissima]|uniref:SH3 domain-containing protein 19 isoform X1 n=1 Tax=Alosa sapidissima TaxID=34773 RepID=UPI001C083394|nr:SH3 domain-containing protein 19 isoform X1 [Alosa sapidissima]XP_041922766.1 SH3 domain-containing protein 19 isoform X1 [Alosa sapidissima]